MSGERFAVELSRDPTANGGDEWSLRVNGERVGEVGVFTDPGRKPAEMLPAVLRRLALGRVPSA